MHVMKSANNHIFYLYISYKLIFHIDLRSLQKNLGDTTATIPSFDNDKETIND